MDKKIRNRILYVVVAGLWAVAIYRTWKNREIKEEMEEGNAISSTPVSPIQFRKDTFELELPDTDPFLHRGWSAPVQSEPVERVEKGGTATKKNPPEPVIIPWPSIEYFGFVRNRDQNRMLCLLEVDGRQVKLSKGETYNGLYVQSAFKDSVRVTFQGDSKTIRK